MRPNVSAFDTDLQELAQFAKLLGHPARLAIVKMLAGKKTLASGDIAFALPLGRSTVSQHLQELKNAQLIKGEAHGLFVNYSLDGAKWLEITSKFEVFFGETREEG